MTALDGTESRNGKLQHRSVADTHRQINPSSCSHTDVARRRSTPWTRPSSSPFSPPVFEETRSIISVLTTTVIALSLEAHIMTPITLTTAHRPPDGDVQRRVLSVVGCRA